MKGVIIGVVIGLSILLGSGILITVEGKGIRQQELRDALSSVMKKSGDEIFDPYRVPQVDEIKCLKKQMATRMQNEIGNDCNLKVEVLTIDLERGLFAVRVQELYRGIGGRRIKISAEKTLLMDGIWDDTYCQVRFYVNKRLLKAYSVTPGSRLLTPEGPWHPDHFFDFWVSEHGNVDEGEWIEVTSSEDYVASYREYQIK